MKTMIKVMLFIYIALLFPDNDTICKADTTTKKLLYKKNVVDQSQLLDDRFNDTIERLNKSIQERDSIIIRLDTIIKQKEDKK